MLQLKAGLNRTRKTWFEKGSTSLEAVLESVIEKNRPTRDQHVTAGDLASGSDIPLKRDAKIPRTRGVAGNNDRRYPR